MMSAKIREQAFHAWLEARTGGFAEVVPGLHRGAFEDFRLDAGAMAARGWSEMPLDVGHGLKVGGYDEDRAVYTSPIFAGDGEEARTVHLGVDIFAAPGTPVFAPLDGRVHSFQDNAGALDYGPTIVLEHFVSRALVFYTLYGHLSRESLEALYPGKPFRAGERMAELGDATVNGGWAPHLHFQVVLDLMGRTGDFPGVVKLGERAGWKTICPDPGRLLGIAP